MYSKLSIIALCAAASVQAASLHRHLHPKREMVWAATDTYVVTEYVTVTVTPGEEVATAEAVPTSSPQVKGQDIGGPQYSQHSVPAVASVESSSTSIVESTTSTVAPASPTIPAAAATYPASSPTTMITAVKPSAPVVESPVPTSTVESSAVAAPVEQYPTTEAQTSAEAATTSTYAATSPTSSAAASTGSATGKRGAAYNDASLVSTVLGLSAKISWAYNWGSDSGNLNADIPYYPMLWSPATDHSSDWDSKAEAAISKGSDHFLSFNEPDINTQANMLPADAATGHIKFMNPYAGRVKISSPAISSSEDSGKGIDWLTQFFTACDGKCQVDFCAAHWYGPGGNDGASLFLDHLTKVHTACDNKPVWVTEFQAISGDVDTFMKTIVDKLESDEYSFVEKYSYFMLSEGNLLSSPTTLSSFGKIFAGVA
ncbi:glycoside hydrolase family 128 protein [Hypoxylon fuscum]|nr:glycoside hydrolase family 128 protein [Hypoxylon fuscum]